MNPKTKITDEMVEATLKQLQGVKTWSNRRSFARWHLETTTKLREENECLLKALGDVKFECLGTTKSPRDALGHIIRICIDAGITQPYTELGPNAPTTEPEQKDEVCANCGHEIVEHVNSQDGLGFICRHLNCYCQQFIPKKGSV